MNIGKENEIIEFKKTTAEIKEGLQLISAILNKHQKGYLYYLTFLLDVLCIKYK